MNQNFVILPKVSVPLNFVITATLTTHSVKTNLKKYDEN